MTAADLIRRSLRLIGVIATGENPSASEQQDALESLNSMLDSFSNDDLVINKYEREVFKLDAGKNVYTVGSGGDFDTSRVMDIVKAKSGKLITNTEIIEIPPVDPLDPPTYETVTTYDVELEMPVRILNIQEFADIQLKKLQSNFVQMIYKEGSYPLERINVWPMPQEDSALVLYSHKPLSTFEDANDDVILPQGYDEMIVYNLAVRLAPEYGSVLMSKVEEIARESLARIKRQNTEPVYLKSDVLGIESNGGRYNIFTGEYDA